MRPTFLLVAFVGIGLLMDSRLPEVEAATRTSGEGLTASITQRGQLSSEGLLLHWVVTNRTSSVLYVYGTFLHGPAVSHESHDGSILVFTSLPRKLEVDVYSYPKSTFFAVDAGRSLEGDFRDPMLNSKWAKTGERLRMRFGFGSEIESVRQALKKQLESPQGGHPANPIVDWQRAAMSNAVVLR